MTDPIDIPISPTGPIEIPKRPTGFQGVMHDLKHPPTPFKGASLGMQVYKGSAVALGALLTANGIYNVVQSIGEKSSDSDHAPNLFHMFIGTFETLAGAGTLFYGLTRGGSMQRVT